VLAELLERDDEDLLAPLVSRLPFAYCIHAK
jgi:hypothetical protein